MKFRLAALAGVAAALLIPGVAHAEDPTMTVNTVRIVSTPDDPAADGSGPWARDTLTRTTTITDTGSGSLVVIEDEGTFQMAGDGPSGEFSGHAQWEVTGELLPDIPAESEAIDRSDATEKGSFTADWWKRFFADDATSPGITGWEFTYSRCDGDARVPRVENESGVTGATYEQLAAVVCPEPDGDSDGDSDSDGDTNDGDDTASPSPLPSSPAADTDSSADPTATPAAAAGGLPVTGADAVTVGVVGGIVLVGGVFLAVIARRRRQRFQA